MTAPEYFQLRAFARIDGLKLFLLWISSFGCYVAGLRSPMLGMVAMALAIVTPFFSARLLRGFRDNSLDGIISLARGWAYVIFQFFYASLLFAIAQFVYFSFLDKGYFAQALTQMLEAPESAEALKRMGMGPQIYDSLEMLRTMRPIDLALNIMTSNLLIGCLIGLPIAAFCKRNRLEKIT